VRSSFRRSFDVAPHLWKCRLHFVHSRLRELSFVDAMVAIGVVVLSFLDFGDISIDGSLLETI